MSEGNGKTSDSQITDLSRTIIADKPCTSNNIMQESRLRATSANSSIGNEEITPEVRELVADEALSVQKTLQEQVRNMVQGEMEDVRKSISDLMRVVSDLAQITSKNKTVETNQAGSNKASNNVTNEPQIIEVAHINPPSVDLNAIPGPSQYPVNQVLTENGQNRTPMSAMSIPALPARTVYSNFVPRDNFNNNQIPPATGNQPNNRFYQNNVNLPGRGNVVNNEVPSGYPFINYIPQNIAPSPNAVVQSDLTPKMWIRIDKWGLNFDGNNLRMSVEDFIFRIERLQAQYHIPIEELERDFHLLLSGPAKDWYWLFVQTNCGVKWPGLKQALLSQYQMSRSNFEIMRDLVERRQNNNETIDQFFQAMNQIRAKLVQGIPEYDMIKILKRNVKESVARIVYPIAVSSVEQLRIECNEAERNFPRREVRNTQPPSRPIRQVNGLYVDHCEYVPLEETRHDEVIEVSAIQLNQQKATLVCWNCKVPGHVFMECPSNQRTLFCYRCGKPNVVTPNCPNCQGNMKRGAGVSGDQRPYKIPNKEN